MSAELRDKLDEALERIRQLEEDAKPSKLMHFFPQSWNLPFKEASILAMLVARSPLPLTRHSIMTVMWAESDLESDKIVDIYLSKIRTSLRRVGVNVQLRHHGAALGWSFAKQDADLLQAICDAEREGTAPLDCVRVAEVEQHGYAYVACCGSIQSHDQLEAVIADLRRAGERMWGRPQKKVRIA